MSVGLHPLSDAIVAAAREFSSDAEPLAAVLLHMVADVERAMAERLEIFPVAHHSPASGLHLLQRLERRPPRVIFMEMCEDMHACLAELGECRLPIALQAFAADARAFDARWAPLSVVAPLTELSAEYQAIAFAHHRPQTELVFVDRSVDHVYQWSPEIDPVHDVDADDDADMHGSALGIEVGSMMPTFGEFHDFLLANARMSHFAEWWAAYVEEPTMGADYATYRRVMFLVGSLIRRLGTSEDHIETDRRRERFMWTRMKAWLRDNDVAPDEALHICGAAHAASDVEEFGADSPAMWDIPGRTETEWLYGLIPSSYSAIEHQFSHPRGTVSLATATWKKAVSSRGLSAYTVAPAKGKKAPKKRRASASSSDAERTEDSASDEGALLAYLHTRPLQDEDDRAQLLGWCTGIVSLARKNGYLASTADSIAIFENAVLLANLRARVQPSPYDFIDAAVTCLEKGVVPGKRSISRLCEMLIGADRIGQVGYDSLPPLVQDVYDRLAGAGVSSKKTTVTRLLFDFRKRPELVSCSDLLWRLHYMLPDTRVARPIMGDRVLGGKPVQESWDVKLAGGEQRHLIELAYEGITVEQVLEKRIRQRVYGEGVTVLAALQAARSAALLLDSPRLCEELGERAVALLAASTGATDSHAIFDIVRELVHYYRTTPAGLPHWLEDFVSTGYRHYCTLLPDSFGDRGTTPAQVAGMLAFVFTLEGLAITLGCNRTQLLIAVGNAAPLTVHPEKKGLLWASEWLLQIKTIDEVRAEFAAVLANRMSMAAFPEYLSGLLLGLEFSPQIAPLGVELLSRAFAELPDAILMPWMPGLLETLRERAGEIMPALLAEARASLPSAMADADAWTPPWQAGAPAETSNAPMALSADAALARSLLFGHRSACEAQATRLGVQAGWTDDDAGPAPAERSAPGAQGAAALLDQFPHSVIAHAERLG